MKSSFLNWKIIVLTLLLADVSYSFFQYLNQPLDGDIAPIVLPWHHYEPVLNDPFGISVFTEGEKYAAPNRFFIHWAMSNYFKTVPIEVQTFFEPIESIYIASALFKIFVHILILGLLVLFIQIATNQISDTNKVSDIFLLAAIFIAPLFNATDYNLYMGIINPAVTYTFFYPFPLVGLMVFFLPFFKYWNSNHQKWSIFQHSIIVILMICLPFTGPLVAPSGLIICGLSLLVLIFNSKGKWNFSTQKWQVIFYFSFFSLLCLYSIYLGTFNIENTSSELALFDRYIQLMEGIFRQLTRKLGVPLLLICIFIHIYLLRRNKQKGIPQKLLNQYSWIGVFCFFYLILLPLGGYRDYRPNIIRSDTFLPVTLGMVYIFGSSALYLWKAQLLKYYRVGVTLILIIFTLADPPNFSDSDCERDALFQLSQSSETVVQIQNDCTIMLWQKAQYPKYSRYVCELLNEWGIMKKDQLFVQE